MVLSVLLILVGYTWGQSARSEDDWPQSDINFDEERGGSGDHYNQDDVDDYSGSGYGPDDEDEEGSGASIVSYDDEDKPDRQKEPAHTKVTKRPKKKPAKQDKNKNVGRTRYDDDDDVVVDVSTGSHDDDGDIYEEEETTTTGGRMDSGEPEGGRDVHILGQKQDGRGTSFFAQPGILAAVIGGAVVGLLCAILLVMFIVYRMRKKDEGSYALDEPKRSLMGTNPYVKNVNKEFYA